jgi:hypothetical protein
MSDPVAVLAGMSSEVVNIRVHHGNVFITYCVVTLG